MFIVTVSDLGGNFIIYRLCLSTTLATCTIKICCSHFQTSGM